MEYMNDNHIEFLLLFIYIYIYIYDRPRNCFVSSCYSQADCLRLKKATWRRGLYGYLSSGSTWWVREKKKKKKKRITGIVVRGGLLIKREREEEMSFHLHRIRNVWFDVCMYVYIYGCMVVCVIIAAIVTTALILFHSSTRLDSRYSCIHTIIQPKRYSLRIIQAVYASLARGTSRFRVRKKDIEKDKHLR